MSPLTLNFLAMLGVALASWFGLMMLKHLAEWLFPKVARRLMGEEGYAEAIRRVDEEDAARRQRSRR